MKILIIKLGALGDVIRTLPLAKAIKEKYPDSEIHWVTKKNALEVFKNNSNMTSVFPLENYKKDSYDLLYNFDTEEDATKIAQETDAKKKFGFFSESGYPTTFNPSAEYYLNTIFDDELKRQNKKTYQEMMFDLAELPYKKQHEKIYLTDEEKNYATEFLKKNNLDKKNLIGIHMGASSRWPSKVWHKENLIKFIKLLDEDGHKIILFGGPNEISEHETLYNGLKKQGIEIYRNNPNNSLREFFSLVNLCEAMVCSDSLALHASLTLKKPTIGLFFCTSFNEVEDYGLLKKMVSKKLFEFFPEKMNVYDEELTKSISSEEVFEAVKSFSILK